MDDQPSVVEKNLAKLAAGIEKAAPAQARQLAQVIAELAKVITQRDNGITKINELVEHYKRAIRNNGIWTIVLIVLTAVVIAISSWQGYLVKKHQDWLQRQMSRAPRLSLEIAEGVTASKDSIRFSVQLVNTGNDIAKAVQARIIVGDTTDTTKPVLKVRGGAVHFMSQKGLVAKLIVYDKQEIVYFSEDTNDVYAPVTPFSCEITNLSKQPFGQPYYIIYYIDCDKGIRKDSIGVFKDEGVLGVFGLKTRRLVCL